MGHIQLSLRWLVNLYALCTVSYNVYCTYEHCTHLDLPMILGDKELFYFYLPTIVQRHFINTYFFEKRKLTKRDKKRYVENEDLPVPAQVVSCCVYEMSKLY